MYRVVELLQLFVNVRRGRGVADVRVDFALEGDADAHGLERTMVDVRRDNGAAARDFAAHVLGLELFPPRDIGHLFGNHALPGEVHLRHVARAVRGRSLLQPLLNPGVSNSHASP